MKILFYLLIIITISGCENDPRQCFTINARKDTTIVVKRHISYRTFMTVKINGKVDDECLMICYYNHPDVVRKDSSILKNEIINQQTGTGYLYGNEAVIEFKHQNNKNGNLKLEVMF